jgi:hypothetical protein
MRTSLIVVRIAGLFLAATALYAQPLQQDLSAYAEKLLALAKEDQEALRSNDRDRYLSVARRNAIELRGIIGEIDWPIASKVGAQASKAAWLIAQHADEDRDLQKRALLALRQHASSGEERTQAAYLEDRLLHSDGQKQRFGTQGRCTAKGIWQPFDIEDPKAIDARRSEMGMDSLASYVSFASKVLCPNNP